MREVWAGILALALCGGLASDDFEGLSLARMRDAGPAKLPARATLSFAELAAAPKPLAEAPQSALLAAKTSEGNWCKLRVRIGGRKAADGAAMPAVQLERFVTYSSDPRKGAIADRKDVLLFPGFAIDLDSGQIVPEDLGADLKFLGVAALSKVPAAPPGKGAMAAMPAPENRMALGGGALHPIGGATLFLAMAPLAERAAAPAPAGYAGAFRLDAAGRWKGTLTLKLAAPGKLSGTFRSADSQAEYLVAGELKRPGKRATLRIAFPRSDLELEGHLWPDEARFAGVARLQEQEFAFVAERAK